MVPIALALLLRVATAALETPLAPGVAREFEVQQGAPRRHLLSLEAGQLLHVDVHVKGSQVGLALLDPSGAEIARRECVLSPYTRIRLLALATVGGTHLLEVRATAGSRGGLYEIRVEPPRTATERDRALVEADAAFAEAVRLAAQQAAARGQAILAFDLAEKGFAGASDPVGQALALLGRGFAQTDQGSPAASGSLQQARDLFQGLGDHAGEAVALHGLGRILIRDGDLDGARALFERAVALSAGDAVREMIFMNGIGVTLGRSGQAEQAIELFARMLSLATDVGDQHSRQLALNNLGIAAKDLGEVDKAIAYYQEALAVQRSTGLNVNETLTLQNIGSLYSQLGDHERALEALEASLRLATAAGNAEVEARVLNDIARIRWRQKDLAAAIELARRSLELRRRIRDRAGEATALVTLGRAFHGRGETDAALEHLGKALEIQQAIRERYAEMDTLLALAAVERDRDNLIGARRRAEAAVALAEELRGAVTSPELRASFVAGEQAKFDFYVDVLMRLHQQQPAGGHDVEALNASERGRARVLLEALVQARADIRQGVAPDLLATERALQKQLNEVAARLTRAAGREDDAAALARLREQLQGLEGEYRQVQSRIRRESPRYADLTQPVAAGVEEVRQEALDDESVLLEFHLGEERSFLWAVTRSEFATYTLPARAAIEQAARRVHDLWTERQRRPSATDVRAADRELAQEAAALSRLLLSGIAPRLEGDWKGKRLVMVASGALAYVPFGALPSPSTPRLLLGDHEIVYTPSASVLVALRRESLAASVGTRTVAILADPVFEPSDVRVRWRSGTRAAKGAMSASPTGLTRAMSSLGREGFGRLPFSRREADGIAALVPRSSRLVVTDFQASRAFVTEGALAGRRIVHFATHGLLDGAHPELSGLVLSLVDESGAPIDGFLRMHEIYNLRVPADLVVLSACQTALGKEMRGEGLIGLTRGFMYAGAKAVVASLWQVDDESTAELMKRFYRGMLKENRRPADALRQAQLEMSKDKRWSAPFYWAGFVLQGEWR